MTNLLKKIIDSNKKYTKNLKKIHSHKNPLINANLDQQVALQNPFKLKIQSINFVFLTTMKSYNPKKLKIDSNISTHPLKDNKNLWTQPNSNFIKSMKSGVNLSQIKVSSKNKDKISFLNIQELLIYKPQK